LVCAIRSSPAQEIVKRGRDEMNETDRQDKAECQEPALARESIARRGVLAAIFGDCRV